MSGYVLPRGNACLPCHNKKQRCDGGKPACHSCLKAQKECVYNEPPKSRAQLLVDRIQKLERRLVELDAGQDPTLGSHSTSASASSSSRSRGTPSPRSAGSTQNRPRPDSGRSSGGSHSSKEGDMVPGANMVWNRNPLPVSTLAQPVDLTPQLRDNLIQVFFQNREKCFFEIHIERFSASLLLRPDNSRAPHPALVNGILLVGCYFSRAPSLVGRESYFLTQAVHGLSASFDQTDRLHDFVRASNLVTFYYLCKGMYTEAYQQVITSAHMAVSCGLHQIPLSVWRPPSPTERPDRFLPPPRDNVDLGERIHTLWQTFCLDKLISMATSQPAHLLADPAVDPSLAVTTPWPRLIIEYETGNVSETERKSVGDLYSMVTPSPGQRSDTLVGLEAQGLSLAHQVFFLMSQRTLPMPHLFAALDAAIESYIARMPSLRGQGLLHPGLASGSSSVNHQVIFIRTLGFTSSLVLHQHATDNFSHSRCGTASHYLASIISAMTPADYGSVFIGLGHVWFIAGQILVTLSQRTAGHVAQQHQNCAIAVLSALKSLSLVYPPLGFQYKQLHRSIYGTL